ncbi:MAG: ABC transporter permease subunit [Treponemataceae bacterium]|nr:ABC transporter permease subunit [Treponemataceae bacterium]
MKVTAALNPDIFKLRQKKYLFSFVILTLVIFMANEITGFKFEDGLIAIPVAFKWMVINFIPTSESLARLPDILNKLFQTILVSIMATTFAGICAFVAAILGSRTTRFSPIFSYVVRFVASFFRNIPVAAWAMIFLFSFGQSNITGLLAIFMETFGFLVRSFLETIDETSSESVEALTATGASWSQIIAQSVVPSSLPQMVSWLLYMVETNIRTATLVGILTGSGIGFAFNMYYKRMNYPAAGLTTLTIVVVVLVIEMLSNRIRRIIL